MLNIKKTTNWILVIAWMIVIFCFSSQTGSKSGALSNEVASKIVNGSKKVKKIATIKHTNTFVKSSLENVDIKKAAAIKRKRALAKKKFYRQTRDVAHCFLYFILSVLFFFALKQHGIASWKAFIFTIIFCIFYSITDEWHQSFVPGRGIEFNDALLDFFGSTLGAIIGWDILPGSPQKNSPNPFFFQFIRKSFSLALEKAS